MKGEEKLQVGEKADTVTRDLCGTEPERRKPKTQMMLELGTQALPLPDTLFSLHTENITVYICFFSSATEVF